MQTLLGPKSWSGKVRPRRMLTHAENRVVSIRKTLRQSFDATPRTNYISRVRDDALSMCGLIERLCKRGRSVSAAEAMGYLDLVEILLHHVSGQLMTLLVSQRKRALG